MDQPDQQPSGSYREGLLALMLVALAGGGFLIFLIFVTGGFFVYVVAAVLATGLIGSFHYLLWGYQLTQEVAEERERELAKLREEADDEFLHDKIRPRRF